MTIAVTRAPRFFRRYCSDREAVHELLLLVLPFSFSLSTWSAARPGPASAMTAAILALGFAASLWAQGWGTARRGGELAFAAGMSLAWLASLAVLTSELGASASSPARALLPALAALGLGGLAVAWRQRQRRGIATADDDPERPLGPAAGALALMAMAAGVLHGLGTRPLHPADFGAFVLAFGLFLALRRRGRSARSGISA